MTNHLLRPLIQELLIFHKLFKHSLQNMMFWCIMQMEKQGILCNNTSAYRNF